MKKKVVRKLMALALVSAMATSLADLSAWRGERKRGERDGEKKKKAYRSWSSNNNYMPYGYYNIIRKGDKSYKVRYYILIYDRFSMRSIN